MNFRFSILHNLSVAAFAFALLAGINIAQAESAISIPGLSAATPAATPAASPSASAPTPAALDNSLDTVIQTLENDQQRAALLAQLKALKSANTQANGDAPEDDNAGLLGAVASGFGSIETQLRSSDTVVQFWSRRLTAAEQQAGTLFARSTEPLFDSATMFLRVLALGGAIAGSLLLLVRLGDRVLRLPRPLPPDARTRDLLVYLLCRVGPWVIAFYATLHFMVTTTPSLGRMFALTLWYTITAGAVFTTVCILLFSLFGGGHRRPAFRVLRQRAPRLLFPIGMFAALGDVTTNKHVTTMLGHDLAITLSTFANLVAATLVAYFVLRLHRPVAHLIRNSSYSARSANRFNFETLRLFAAVWYLPVLLLVTVSSLETVLTIHRDNLALRRAIATSGLLVLGFFATAMVRRGFVLVEERRAQRLRPAPYAERFLKVLHALLVVALWLAVVQLTSLLWGGSTWNWLHNGPIGRRVATSLLGIGSTILAGSLLWIVLDTAIREAISPSRPRSGFVPSTRALTVLPLVRNALFLLLLVIGVIATLANLGIDVTPLIAGAGVIGIALGLGAQTLVKDFLTGIFILMEDTLAVGDVVEMDSRSGTVEGLTIRTVRLRDGDGAVHAIPFSEIKAIKNQSRQFSYAVFNVRITYDSDVDEALKLIRETGAELLHDTALRRDIIGSLEVFGLDHFAAGAIVLQSRLKTRPLRQYDVGRAFNILLKAKFDASHNTRFAIGEQLLRMLPSATASAAMTPSIGAAVEAAPDLEAGSAPHAP